MDSVAGTQTFGAGGRAYDAFMGRYSRPLGPLFADAAGVAVGQHALDVGCGTGALTGELVRRLGADHVAGCDPSPMLQECRARYPDVDLRAGRAEELPFDDDSFDLALAQLVMHFVTDADRSAAELQRVVRPGGTVAVNVWDFEGGMQMLRHFWDAAVSLDPDAPDELHTMRFGRAGELADLLAGVGLKDVAEVELRVEAGYAGFDDLWSTLTLAIGPAGVHLASLPEERQQALRAAYRERLGSPEGPFRLAAVARAAVGKVPG